MRSRCGLLLGVAVLCFLAEERLAFGFYRCLGERGEPKFFPIDGCQLVSDPTMPFQSVVPEVAVVPPKVAPEPETRVGSWTVTQIIVPSGESGDWEGEKQAVINHRRVGVGAVVDGGRVQDITRAFVVMAHAGGETQVLFNQETVAYADAKPMLRVSLQELGKELPHLLQRLARGETVLIIGDGKPLARLLPISPEVENRR